MTLRTEILAFRIWAFAHPREWDCTLQELADALGESLMRISAVCRDKKWSGRLRGTGSYYLNVAGVQSSARQDEVASVAMNQLRATNPYGTMEKAE